MKKSVFLRLTDEEFEKLESYCESRGRSKSDALRELIRSLKLKKIRQAKDEALDPIFR
ncbi:ribbon-helix-helix protein, CopG family [Microcoleus sp. D3_18a_C4]|uniref:ribbon-helix-helix protein, CopG family n=1 Tax=Microcoleus sp. D3_18a_C4 TaxID=3055332 RepID=UPI002FD1490B